MNKQELLKHKVEQVAAGAIYDIVDDDTLNVEVCGLDGACITLFWIDTDWFTLAEKQLKGDAKRKAFFEMVHVLTVKHNFMAITLDYARPDGIGLYGCAVIGVTINYLLNWDGEEWIDSIL